MESPIAVISGAAGQLGSRVLSAFRGEGYRCVGLDATERPGAEAWLGLDVTSEEAVVEAFAHIRKEWGRPSVLVQTVGMWGMSPLLDTTLADWHRMVDVNLTSTFLLFREAVRAMLPGPGRLIGITSRQGADSGAPEQAAYSASKGGLIRLVESVSAEYAEQGITAHAIAPSLITQDEKSTEGVHVDRLVSLCLYLAGREGAALGGATIRAYG